MSRPQVTITLGSYGQRVVKHSSGYDYASSSGQRLSGSKRSFTEPFANDYLLTKRARGDVSSQGSRYTGSIDARIGKKDLRLKLLRKRMSKQILENEERKNKEMQAKLSGVIQHAQQYDRIRLANTPLPRRVPLELAPSSYASKDSDALRPRSPNRVLNDSREIQYVQLMRPADATRTVHLGATKSVTGMMVSSGSVPRSSYPNEEFLTVSGLLNALGLGKYAIHFQAEEVDMAALKQMGDRDLKEIGIPMGPRKKILLAILARNKNPKPTGSAHKCFVY